MSQIPPGKFGGCLPREVPFGQGPWPCLPERGTDGTPNVMSWAEIADLRRMTGDLIRKWGHWKQRVDQEYLSSCTTGMYVNGKSILRSIEGKETPPLAMAGLYAFEGIRFVQDGDRELYQLIPRSRDNGMGLISALLIAQVVGIPPAEIDGEKYIDPLDWQGLRLGRWPSDWMQQAALYRFSEECYDIPSCQAGMSELTRGRPWQRGMDNHAVLQASFADVAGSWGRDHGDEGWHPWGDPWTAAGRRAIDAGIATYGAFCPRATRPDDEPPAEGLRGVTPFDMDDDEGRRRRQRRGIWRGRRR